MGAKVISRHCAQGKAKKLQHKQQPLTITIEVPPPRNPVAFAMAHRAASSAAGKHIRTQGAVRRAEKVSLLKLVRQQDR